MSEVVSGTLNALMTRGWKGDLQCHLVFTNQRLIVSVKGMLAQIAAGSGAFGIAGAAVGGAMSSKEEAKKRGQIEQLSPDQLVQSNKKNLNIPYSTINKLELGKKLGTSRLYVVTKAETHKFKFQGVALEEIEKYIRQVIPQTVTVQTVDKLSD